VNDAELSRSRSVLRAALLGLGLLSPSAASAAATLEWISYSSAPAAVDSVSAYVPVFSWSFRATGANGGFEGAYLTSFSEVPPSQMTANLFRDDGDGVLDPAVDQNIATAPFTNAGFATQAQLSSPGETQTQGAWVRYFVTVSFNGVPQGRNVHFGVFDEWELETNGQFFTLTPNLPIFSGDSSVYYKLFAKPANGVTPYPTPSASPRTGGFDTGLFVNPGQRLQVQVAAADSWDVGGGLMDGDGGGPNGVLGAWPRGVLTARVGAGPWFRVGQSTTVTAGSQGLLYVAANDSDGYSNNSGSLRFTLGVLPSTSTKVWLGGTLGFENRADLDQNWQGGRPRRGERAYVGSTAHDLHWNISNEEISELVISTAFAGRVFRLAKPPYGGVNTLRVSSVTVIGGGRFEFEPPSDFGYGSHELQSDAPVVVKDSATLALDHGRLSLRGSLQLRNGAFLRLSSTGTFPTQVSRSFGSEYDFIVDRATLAVAAPLELDGIQTLVLDRAKVAAFDSVTFYSFSGSTAPFVRFLSPVPFAATFKGWSSSGSPRTLGVDAQLPGGSNVLLRNSVSPSFGSPRTSQLSPNTVFWDPDGGGTPGTIDGTLSCLTGCTAGQYSVLVTTDPRGFPTPQGDLQTQAPGLFSFSGLEAPATYYLFAFEAGVSPGVALGTGPRGGYGHPGFVRSEKVFLPDGGASLNSKDIDISAWGTVTGAVTNNSPQVGPIVVETWDGPPYNPGSTKVAQGFANPGFSFDTRSTFGPVFHSSHVFAYVDLDGDRDHDPFEASASAANNSFSPAPGGVANVSPPLNIGGGSTPPGGLVALSTQSLTAGAISNGPDQGLLRLTLANSASGSAVSALRLRWAAQPPPSGVSMKVWEDDGDGVFEPNADQTKGSLGLFGGSTSGTVSFFEPVALGPSQTKHLFVSADTFGSRPSSAAVAIDTPTAFGMSAGAMDSQPSLYPVLTGPLEVRVGVPGFQYASPDGYGGSFTGFHLSPGQDLSLTFSGSWSTAPAGAQLGGAGAPGTSGQNTVFPEANVGELIGRVEACPGCPSSWFRVGGATMPIANFYGGELKLAMNDYVNAHYDNGGSQLVNFGVSGSTTGALTGFVYYSTPVAGNGYVTAYRYGNSVASVTVSFILASTSYAYTLPQLLPGEYRIEVVHQLNSDFGVSGRAFVSAGSTVSLDAVMYQARGSIAGPISYSGVLNYGDFFIAASTSNDFTREVHFAAEYESPTPGGYSLSGLPAPATYYVVGFRDGNFNDQPDGPEPFGYHGAPGGSLASLAAFATPIYVPDSTPITGKSVTLEDSGGFTGPVFVSTSHGGVVSVVVGRGTPGSASFQPESKALVPVFGGGSSAGPLQYSLGLLRSATDYGLFAFHDRDGDEFLDAGEPSFQTAPNLVVSSGSMSNLALPLLSAAAPPASPRFSAVATGTSTVLFTWDGVSGATNYLLRRANDSLFATVGATYYIDASLSANTSSQILKLVVANGNGSSAAVLLSTSVYSLAGAPVAPGAALSATGGNVTWSAGVNPAGTLYRVYRSTIAGGASPRLVSQGPALSFSDAGLAPDTFYRYDVSAVNGNGLEMPAGGSATGMTAAAAGNVLIGTVAYAGAQSGAIVVQASTATSFTGAVSSVALPNLPVQPFLVPGLLGAGSYFVRAFVDANGNGALNPGEDSGSAGPLVLAGAPNAVAFAVSKDTVPPAAPAGLVASPGFGSVGLTWVAPTKNANGSSLVDLLGYVVQRSTGVSAPFVSLQSTSAPVLVSSFTDTTAKPGAPAFYRVVALDLGRNASAPTAAQLAAPSAGGSISGRILSYTAAASGPFRVRLTTSPAPGASALAEVSVPTYTFTGLSDGTYFLRGYRDLNSNGSENPTTEPGGTYGGLNTPFAVPVVNGNAVTLADVAVCDRTQLFPGPAVAGSLQAGGCPARDKGPSNVTQLFSLPVGNGAAGSLGLGTQVNISITDAQFGDSELIVLGPDGSVVGRDNRAGGASLSFTASQAGVYLVEPTSFLPGSTGTFSIQLRLDGGFGGVAQGTVAYTGSRGGVVYTQLFAAGSDSPVAQSTRATPGFFSFPGLPDGVYTLRAFRDVNGNLVRDLGEPTGQFGFSASSPTPVVVAGGFTVPAGGLNLTMSDPAVGAMKGAVIYDGTAPGSIRIQAGLPSCDFCGDIQTLVASASTGAANGYFLDSLPAATYYVLKAFVDNNGNGRNDVLEPVISENAVTVTAGATTTVSVILQDPGSAPQGAAVIRGTITYSGASTGTIFVGFSRDPYFNSLELVLQLPSTGYFQRDGVLGDTTYYMAGFIDTVPNGTPDFQLGEPRGTGPQVYVPEFGVVDASMTIVDAPDGSVRGRVTYAGASLAPLIYVQAARFVGFGLPSQDAVETVIVRQPGVTSYEYALERMAAAGDYYVQAFVDSNGNGRSDQGEPFNSRSPVSVSSGAGSFPAYGKDLTIFESGGTGGSSSGGRIRGDVSYLGSQGGNVYVRFFTNPSFSGQPFATIAVPGIAGPGMFPFDKTGLPFGVTFYIDAFRDPSNSGVYNPTFHARAPLTEGGEGGVVLTQSRPQNHAFGHLTDPGEGGSINVFSGRFDVPSGARFDGGSFDVAATVVIDTWTGSPPPTYVVQLVTTQNDGVVESLVRYSSAGVMLSSGTINHIDGAQAPLPTASGHVVLPFREDSVVDGNHYSTGAVTRLNADFGGAVTVRYALREAKAYAYSPVNRRLYIAGPRQDSSDDIYLLEIDPVTMNVTSTGTYTMPSAGTCFNCGGSAAYGVAVSQDGQKIAVTAVSGQRDGHAYDLMFLLAFDRPGGGVLPNAGSRDITGLRLPSEGINLAYDPFGNLFASGVERGDNVVRTYKFDPSLNTAASAQLPNVVLHFEGGIGNMQVDRADGHVYQAWESSANAGDYQVLRYDNGLNLLYTRGFDGLNNTAEDFPFSLTVLDSSNVVVAGGVNNGRTLDSAVVRFNMNAAGSVSAAGPAVTVSTVQPVYGTVGYAGSLVSSGVYQTVLLPAGQVTPLRFATAAFAASRPYLFNNVPFGPYYVRSFLDLDGDLVAEAGEPVAWSKAEGEQFVAGSSYAVAALTLCDRRALAPGVPVSDSFSAADCPAPDRGGAYQRLYTFTARRGEPVTLSLEGLGFSDTYLSLYGPAGDLLFSADDGGAGADARISGYVIPADGLYTVAASPFAAGVTGAFRLTLVSGSGSPGSVSGRVDYNGSQGGAIQVGRFTAPSLSTSVFVDRIALTSTRAFTFSSVAAGTTYYFGAFVDVNANNALDAGEDFGVFGAFGSTVPAPVPVQVGQAVTGVTINVAASTAASASASFITGQVTLAGAPQAGLILEFWSSSQFTGRPVASRLIPTGVGAFDVTVPGGLSYFVRAFLDVDGDFFPDASEPKGVYAPRGQGAESVFAPAGASVPNVDISLAEPGLTAGGAYAGEGTGALMPSAAGQAGAQPASIQVELTAGPHGIDVGGQVGFTVPPGFPFPSNVTASATGGATVSPVTINGPSAFTTVTGGGVAEGFTVTLTWNSPTLPCQPGVYPFKVASAENGTAAPAPLLNGSPSFTVSAGAAESISVNPPYFTLRVGELSEPLFVETRDRCGNKVAATAAEVLELRAKAYNPVSGGFDLDAEVGLASSTLVSTASAINLGFAIGQSSRAFHAVSASTGFKFLELFSDLGAAPPSTYYFGASVVPANALTNVRVSSSPSGVAGSTAAIGQTASGVPNSVFIDFSLGDPGQYWHVLFTTTPFKPGAAPLPVWERWGGGQPSSGELAWDGRFSPWINGGNRVPNGLYYGRVELGGGGVKDDRIQVTVNVPQLGGRVFDSAVSPNPPLANASLRVYGPSGSYAAVTGADGVYNLPGLGAGSYRLQASRPDYVDAVVDVTLNASAVVTGYTLRSAGVAVSSNAAGGLDVFLGRAPRLTVLPSIDVSITTTSFDQWGSLQVRTATGSALATLFGPMRLRAGTTFFDDGGQWDPATQQFVARTQLSFNVPVGTYTVQGELAGFTRSSETVYVGEGGAFVTLVPFQKKSSVKGQVTVPGPNTQGTFVSVTAVPLSTAAGSAGGFGGVFINPGLTVSSYVIGGLDAGAYLLRANAQGLSVATTGPLVLGANAEVADYHFPGLGAGATLSGDITVGGTSSNGTALFINAWAPGSLNFGSTQVYTTAGTNVVVPYSLKGLDASATYQMYVGLSASGDYDVPGGFPLLVVPQAGYDFTLQPASGAISGLIRLPAGATDFLNVELRGVTIAHLRPQEVGHEFVEVSTTLPNFKCGDGADPVGLGYCANGVSSATFLVPGVNTQTLDITFFHRTSGQNAKQRLSVVNGSTSTLTADLSGAVFSIGGSIVNQVSHPLFDTTPEILANAPYLKPLGYPAGLSSSTARVTAVRQELESFGVAISTVFNEATSRVGFIQAGGSFTIAGVPSGVYYVRTIDLRACATCDILVPSVGRIVTVSGAAVSSVTLTLSDGYSVSGSVSLDDEISDWAIFDLQVLNKRQEVVRSTTAYLGDSGLGVFANAVNFQFNNLPAGEFYTLVARDRRANVKYVGRPIKFPDPALSPTGLQASLTAQNIVMKRAGQLIGRLKDGGTGELINAANATLLAPNFRVTATANPWIEGGFVVAAASVSGRPVQADGYFRVGPLLPGVDYDLRLAQTSWDPSFLQGGSQNYAPVTLGGLRLSPGESRDVGVVALGQGRSITGVVRSTVTGAGLGAVKVVARPSFGGEGDLVSQSFTNNAGAYTLWVSTQISNQFDVTAAPRDGNKASDGLVYGLVTLRNLNLLAATTANFNLTPLAGGVTGQVVVADAATGGMLSYPFGDRRGFPAAAVNLQPQGVIPQNPLGDIETATDERGFFSIPGLSTGIYTLHATSLGYGVFNATAAVTASSFRLFTGSNTPTNDLPGSVITLQRGASVTGRILKSDGSAPNASEVTGVAAANFAAGEFVIGSVETDAVARTVNAYTISGFRAGVTYDLVLISGDDGENVSFPTEGNDISFSAAESTATKTINLTFKPAKMDCLGTAKALDAARTQFTVQVDCLKPLRNETALDADLDSLLRVSTFNANGQALVAPNGTGGFLAGSKSLSSDRKRLTGVYQKAANESRFSVRVVAAASDVDPTTGLNFTIDKAFDFYTGLESATDGRVSNINGGRLNLTPSAQDELLGLDERGGLSFQPGTFAEGSDSASEGSVVANPTVTVNVTMTKSTDRQLAQTFALKQLGYIPAGLQAAENGSSYPSEVWAAMSAYRAQASTSTIGGANPLSSFYSIFLPLGVRHSLKKRADLTMSFSTLVSTGVTQNNINVWFYNASTGRYEQESTDKRVDMVNKTITVSVDHFSTFVVLDSTPVLTSAVSFAGSDIIAASFPNPADCVPHAGILRNSTFFAGGTIPTFTGQMIRASLPPGDGAQKELTVNVYNLSGQKVRSMPQGPVSGGQTYYMPWNCSNDNGQTVSSGVYFGEIKWGSYRKFIKMAIIKGSGL
jgi:uncharacterized protein (DUF2141 family)